MKSRAFLLRPHASFPSTSCASHALPSHKSPPPSREDITCGPLSVRVRGKIHSPIYLGQPILLVGTARGAVAALSKQDQEPRKNS